MNDNSSTSGAAYKLSSESQIFDFKLGKTIGEGAFSKVKLGWHTGTGKRVAIKIIDKKLTAVKVAKSIQRKEKYLQKTLKSNTPTASHHDKKKNEPTPTRPVSSTPCPFNLASSLPKDLDASSSWVPIISPIASPINQAGISTLDLLYSEVKLLMRLNHPNIIGLYQVIDTELECFIIMEYAAGGDLIDYIESKQRLTESESRRFFRQLISALHHCHSANVVHRDLKLENLLLTDTHDLLVTDFGLGRTFYQPTDYMYTFCGTPSYAAIELIQYHPYQGIPADLWSMGVILFVMCSGRMPFYGSTLASLYSRILALEYTCPDYFSSDLKSLFSKIFVKDPCQRITMQELMQDPWVNYESLEPILILPPLYTTLCEQGLEQIHTISKDTLCTVFSFTKYHTEVLLSNAYASHPSSSSSSSSSSFSGIQDSARELSFIGSTKPRPSTRLTPPPPSCTASTTPTPPRPSIWTPPTSSSSSSSSLSFLTSFDPHSIVKNDLIRSFQVPPLPPSWSFDSLRRLWYHKSTTWLLPSLSPPPLPLPLSLPSSSLYSFSESNPSPFPCTSSSPSSCLSSAIHWIYFHIHFILYELHYQRHSLSSSSTSSSSSTTTSNLSSLPFLSSPLSLSPPSSSSFSALSNPLTPWLWVGQFDPSDRRFPNVNWQLEVGMFWFHTLPGIQFKKLKGSNEGFDIWVQYVVHQLETHWK